MRYLIIIYMLFSGSAFCQWSETGIAEGAEIYSIYYDNGKIYAGSTGKIFIGAAEVWKELKISIIDEEPVTAIIKAGEKLIAGTYNFGVIVSKDDGETWSDFNAGLKDFTADDISGLTLRGEYVYVSTIGASIFRINYKTGTKWETYHNNIPVSIASNSEFINNFNDTLIAGGGGNGYIYMNSYENLWNEYQFDVVSGEAIIMLDVFKRGETLYGAANTGLYLSYDAGNNWTKLPVNTGAVSNARFAEYNNYIYLMTNNLKNGTTIYRIEAGEDVRVFEKISNKNFFAFFISEGKMWGGGINGGLWYRAIDVAGLPENPLPARFGLEQNFPNPFNPVTSFKYYLNEAGYLKLSIYNNLGELITVLREGTEPAGEHTAYFNGESYGSGIYIYELKDGYGRRIVKKMMLLK